MADRFKAVSQSMGTHGDAVRAMSVAAAVTRFALRDPKRAITIYDRAAALNATRFPQTPGHNTVEVLDIELFDLGDRAAAAKHLRADLERLKPGPPPARADYAAWQTWWRHWLEAELAYVEQGKRFNGSLTADDLFGFTQPIFFGPGSAALIDPPGREFNAFANPVPLTPALRAKLLQVPGSHSMFLRTWMFAARLTDPADARKWLERNDSSGFWRDCLLALTAFEDRHHDPSERSLNLARTRDGKVTGFALLAREWSKTHALPKVPQR